MWSAVLSAVLLYPACVGTVIAQSQQAPPAAPAANEVESVIYLIGDAGDPNPAGEPVLQALTEDLRSTPAPGTVIFLGDNLYPAGLSGVDAADRAEGERRLRAQVEAALAGGAVETWMLPGNHDWNFAGEDGYARILDQESFVESLDGGSVDFLPDAACPGPVVRDIGATMRLVMIDTEWWLRDEHRRPADPSCATSTEEQFREALKTALTSAGERNVVVAGHHPMVTGGPHGGHFTLRQHLFPLTEVKSWAWLPLPVLGSAYPLMRNRGISNQDLSGPLNKQMRASLREAFSVKPPLLYAAGHEHSLQIHEGREGSRYHVVSGTGIYGHTSPVKRTRGTLFATGDESGYVKLEAQRDGRVYLSVVTVDAQGGRRIGYSMLLDTDS
jgi:hypothetical protein